MKKKEFVQKVGIYLLPMIFIMALVLFHIKDNYLIKVFPDEYGYWAAGSFFAGLNWEELTSRIGYFGYGYGLILGLLLKLPISAVDQYQAAIVINGMLLCLIYVIALKTIGLMASDMNWPAFQRVLLALLGTIIPTTLYYAQYTMCEAFLVFLYWMFFYAAVRLYKDLSIFNIVLFNFCCAGLFATHMKTIGAVAVGSIYVLFILARKKKVDTLKAGLFIVSMVGFWLLLFFAKNGYNSNYRSYSNVYGTSEVVEEAEAVSDKSSDPNDIKARIQMLVKDINPEGIRNLFHLIVGHLFYSFVSTALLIMIPIGFFAEYVILLVKKRSRSLDTTEGMLVFSAIIFFAELLVACTPNMGGYDFRFDLLTYGRYFEFTVGPLILCGVVKLFRDCDSSRLSAVKLRKIWISGILIFLVLSIVTDSLQNYEAGIPGNSYLQCMYTYFWGEQFQFSDSFFLGASLMLVFVNVVLAIIWYMFKGGWFGRGIILSTLIFYGIFASHNVYGVNLDQWGKREQKIALDVGEYLLKHCSENEIYVLGDNDYFFCLSQQVILKDSTIHYADSLELINSDRAVILVKQDEEVFSRLVDSGYVSVFEKGFMSLWKQGG